LIEAKNSLDRTVVGQIEVGKYLVERDFEPAEIICVALCSSSHPDIEEYCFRRGIKVEIFKTNYKGANKTTKTKKQANFKVIDKRCPPDKKKFDAFKKGWAVATRGEFYDEAVYHVCSVKERAILALDNL
jgi:hypothetical protein